jgi:murein L,D-transpeptidase YafK
MVWLRRILRAVLLGLMVGGVVFWWLRRNADVARINEVRRRVTPRLRADLRAAGFRLGDAVFVRVFKESRQVEVWLRPRGAAEFGLFRSYATLFSGRLGPKIAEGDGQAPEGFYRVAQSGLNPNSTFHLAFNLGYPNECDAANGRTGSWIMMHGGNQSVGCFAMTDPVIEEIYLIVEAALRAGQPEFLVHVFPFRMTGERMKVAAGGEWLPFWENLREGYELFEKAHIPPVATVREKRYVFGQ